MTNELPNLDEIEAYLGDLLSAEERAKFEQELTRNPALKKEFDLVQDLLTGIDRFGDDAVKAQIGAAKRELEAEGFFEKKTAKVVELQPARQRLWQRWAVAASILAVCGTALFWWMKQSDPYQDFFKQNFQAEDIKIAAVIDDSSASGLLTGDRERRNSLASALRFYQAKDYAAAAKALSAHHQSYPQDTVAQFYLAISEIHHSDYDKAIALLQPLAPEVLNPGVRFGQASQGIDFQNEMTWYLALAYSKRPGQAAKDSTLLLLRRLESRGDSFYSEKARVALLKLGN